MDIGDAAPPPDRSRFALVVVLAIVAAAAAVAWLMWSRATGRDVPPPARPSTAVPAAPPPARAEPAPAPARREPAAPAGPVSPARPERPAAPPAPEIARGVLRVQSDVAGAAVFLNRKYLGTTPFETAGLAPGTFQLNVSAEGYEGQARTVEIGAEPVEVTIAFTEVRLDTSIPVVHKHGVGSCEGRLVATVDGLRYETTSRDDAFTMPFPEVEGFEIDYLKKNLRVKRRGGKTWNFTDRGGSADPLFVFHRDVQKARTRLSSSR